MSKEYRYDDTAIRECKNCSRQNTRYCIHCGRYELNRCVDAYFEDNFAPKQKSA